MKKLIDYRSTAAAFLIIVTFALFANSLPGEFLWDDKYIIVERAPFYEDLGNIFRAFTVMDTTEPDPTITHHTQAMPYYRPLTALSFFADYQIWGLRPLGYHLENVLLHALAVLLLYLLALRLFKDPVPALFSALLFAVHPVNAEAVNFLSGGRNTLLCAVFMLGSLIALERRKEIGRPAWPALLLFSAALFSKEPAVVLPLFVLLWDILRPGKDEKSVGPKLIGAFFGITALYFALRLLVLGVFISEPVTEPFALRAGLVLSSLFEHFRHLLVPVGLSAAYDVEPVRIFSLKAAVAAVGYAGLLYAAYRKDAPKPLRWGALWLALGLLPVINIVPIPSAPVADRYLYIPAIGFCLMAGSLFGTLYNRRRAAAMTVAAVLLVVFSSATFMRNSVWQTRTSLWEDAVKKSPMNAMAHKNLGSAYETQGLMGAAMKHYKVSLKLSPEDSDNHYNLGVVYWSIGRPEMAARHYEKALELNPVDEKIYNNLGVVYEKLGLKDKAIERYRSAVRLRPGWQTARTNLGIALAEKGQYAEAIEHLGEALRLNPRDPSAHNNLGSAFKDSGNKKKAEENFLAAITLQPGYSYAHYNLGVLYYEQGLMDKAQKEFETTLSITPSDPDARRYLGQISKKN